MDNVLQIILRKNYLFQNFQLKNPNDFDKEDIDEFKNTTVNQDIIKKQKQIEIDSKMALLDKFDYFIKPSNYNKLSNIENNSIQCNNSELKKIKIPITKLNSNINENNVHRNKVIDNKLIENKTNENIKPLLPNKFKIPNINSCLSNIKKVKNENKNKNTYTTNTDDEIKIIKLS